MGEDLYYKKTVVKKSKGCSHALMDIFKVRYEDQLKSSGLFLDRQDIPWLEGIIDVFRAYNNNQHNEYREQYIKELQKLIEEIIEFDSVELFIY